MLRSLFLLVLLMAMLPAADPPATAADSWRMATADVRAAASGDAKSLRAAQQHYVAVWPRVEDSLRSRSRSAYATIESEMGDLDYALQPDSLDLEAAHAAANKLVASTEPWLASEKSRTTAPLAIPATGEVRTLQTVIARIEAARSEIAGGRRADAEAAVADVRQWWPDVESAVKTRDVKAYGDCEDLMARAAAQLSAGDARADATLVQLIGTMQPFTGETSYGIADVFVILLREGVEALLVISALLAFLDRTGHGAKKRWIWGGALAGVGVSLALALAINLLFKAVFKGTDRELLEGVVGLVAAGLLFWVSWWLHLAATRMRWNASITDRTQAALATGSVASLTFLAFLAVVREGAETALFLIGMAPCIATRDLLLGLGLGGVALAVIGVTFVALGSRLPLRPFFTVLGLLVLAMGVKFIGTGIHALQVSGYLPASVLSGLPTINLVGFFPTRETLFAQMLALLLVVGLFWLGSRRSRPARIALDAP